MNNPDYFIFQENFCFNLLDDLPHPEVPRVQNLIDLYNTVLCKYYNLFVPEIYMLYTDLSFEDLVKIPEFFTLKEMHARFFNLCETLYSIPLAAVHPHFHWAHLDISRAVERFDALIIEMLRLSEFIGESLIVPDDPDWTFSQEMFFENANTMREVFDDYASLLKVSLEFRNDLAIHA